MKRELFRFDTNALRNSSLGLDQCLSGKTITGVAAVENPRDQSLMFVNHWSSQLEDILHQVNDCLIVVSEKPESQALHVKHDFLVSNNPRRDYALALTFILQQGHERRTYKHLDGFVKVIVSENVRLGSRVKIAPFVSIGHDTTIGDHVCIEPGVRIGPRVVIGDNSVIRENSVIGGQGFGVERGEDGSTIRIPHLGGVMVGKQVEIGALNTVASGTMDSTVVEDYVKTDDHVHIAHNCRIGKGSIITASAELSGTVSLGSGCWIGPNASITNGVSLGQECLVGVGAVVTKNFGDAMVIAGNPAEPVEDLKRWRKWRRELLEETYKCK